MRLNDIPLEAVASIPRPEPQPVTVQALARLLELAHRARHAASEAELGFVLVNETHTLVPYRQAALVLGGKVTALSGVASPEANAPYVQWLQRVAAAVASARSPRLVLPTDLAAADAAEWDEWLPAHLVWLPIKADEAGGVPAGGLLLARDETFEDAEASLLVEWLDPWRHALVATRTAQVKPWQRWLAARPAAAAMPWHRRALRDRRMWVLAAVVVAACIPVRLNVLAPADLVAAHPAVIRSPLEGTVDRFFVEPNATVKAGDKLFQLDLAALTSKLDVARQALVTAEAEYRQQAQLAVFDIKSKGQLSLLEGRIAERRTEAEFLASQLSRAQVVAPRDGVVILDDPTEFIGKPVAIGERVLSVADAHDVEVEAWLAPSDAVDLPQKAAVTLYLNARPLSPVSAELRYVAYEAVARPDGSFAYRLRATLPNLGAGGDERVGLKGTAKISGGFVPAVYWVLRRPLAYVRQTMGW